MRDITLNDTFTQHFTTRQFSDGVPTLLAGSPVIKVHEEGNDAAITVGITLDVSIGVPAVVGFNEVEIVATAGNGYEVGKSYAIFISTGTVGGVSVVGEVVGHFTVALSAAAVDLANGVDGLTELRTLILSQPTVAQFDARTQPTADYFDPAADDVDVRSIQANVITAASINFAAITGAKIAANAIGASQMAANAINATVMDTDAIGSNQLAATAVQEIVDAILDEASASHVTAGSVGLTIDNLPDDGALTSRTLASAAYFDPAVDDVDVRAIQANVITATSIATGAIGTSAFAIGGINATALNADAIDKIRDGILPTENAAFSNLMFLFVAASDGRTPVTGATGVSGTRSIDGGAFVGVSGTIAEVANGIYQFDALAADMNGGKITFRFIASGGTPGAPDDTFVTIITGGGV